MDSICRSMPPPASHEILSQCTRRAHIPKSDPRTFCSKRVVSANRPTSQISTSSIRRSSFNSPHARRNAEMFLRSLTPIQLANLRAAIIDRLKQRRKNLKEKHQIKACNAFSNSSRSTPPRSQSNRNISKGYTSRPIFATQFHTSTSLKLPTDKSSDTTDQSMGARRESMQ